MKLDSMRIFRTFAGNDHAEIRGIKRTLCSLLQSFRDHCFRVRPIRRRVVAGAIAKTEARTLRVNLHLSKLAVPSAVDGIEADGVGEASVFKGLVDRSANVIVAKESQAARAIRQQFGGVARIKLHIETRSVFDLVRQTRPTLRGIGSGVQLNAFSVDGIHS